MKRPAPHPLFVLALLASGCRPGAGSASFVEHDSAGVRVVDSARPLWRAGRGWRVDSFPAVEFRAGPAGPPREVLVGAILPSGGIVVADEGSQEVRWYDGGGRYLRAARGDGTPGGEFGSLSALAVLDDGGVLAWDGASRRSVRFAADGAPGPSVVLTADEPGRLEGVFGDGSLLFGGASSNVFVVSPVPRREPFALVRYSGPPPRVDTLRRELGPEEFTWGGEAFALRQAAPFGRRTFVAARGKRLWIADSERFEVRTCDDAGRLLRVARASVAPRPIDARERERFRARLAARARGSLPAKTADSLLASLPFPATRPAFSELRIDSEGRAWLRGAASDDDRQWTVLDERGRMLGTVLLPPGLQVLDIGQDFILGVWKDARGNEHLRLHGIRRR
ncbi:hypothetical protein SAMN05216486_10380 [bacterium JGI 053]|nr:hypothetical protein SAMN05216486_10380 [bacterium JGI 053]